MLKKMEAFVREEEGQGMAEYGLILAGVAVVAIVAYKQLGSKISSVITSVVGKM